MSFTIVPLKRVPIDEWAEANGVDVEVVESLEGWQAYVKHAPWSNVDAAFYNDKSKPRWRKEYACFCKRADDAIRSLVDALLDAGHIFLDDGRRIEVPTLDLPSTSR